MVDKGNIEITKVDKENGAVLAGVEFEVQDEKDEVVRKVVTDKDGKVTWSRKTGTLNRLRNGF